VGLRSDLEEDNTRYFLRENEKDHINYTHVLTLSRVPKGK